MRIITASFLFFVLQSTVYARSVPDTVHIKNKSKSQVDFISQIKSREMSLSLVMAPDLGNHLIVRVDENEDRQNLRKVFFLLSLLSSFLFPFLGLQWLFFKRNL